MKRKLHVQAPPPPPVSVISPTSENKNLSIMGVNTQEPQLNNFNDQPNKFRNNLPNSENFTTCGEISLPPHDVTQTFSDLSNETSDVMETLISSLNDTEPERTLNPETPIDYDPNLSLRLIIFTLISSILYIKYPNQNFTRMSPFLVEIIKTQKLYQ